MQNEHELYRLTLQEAKKIASKHPDASFNMCLDVYEKAKRHHYRHIEGLALVGMAFASRSKSDINAMLEYGFLALPLLEAEDDVVGQVRAYNLIGIAYYYGSMFEEALRYFLKVLEKLKPGIDDILLSSVYNNIGEVYRESSNYSRAKEHYEEALTLSIDQHLKLNEATILGNIGEIHYALGEIEQSLDYFLQSHEILTRESDMVSLGEVENRIGKIYYLLNQDERALDYYTSAKERLEGIANKYYAIDVFTNLAQFYLKSDADTALNYYLKAADYAHLIDSKKKLCDINLFLSEFYEQKKDYQTSLEYHKTYCHINEEIMASSLSKKLEILQIEINYMNQNLRYEDLRLRLEREINNQRNELERIKHTNTQLEIKAHEDELTKIKNRRGFFIDFEQSIQTHNPQNVVVMMLDLDHFKRYNDDHGHSKGDACLVKVAEAISQVTQKRRGVFGRFGGEEFIYASCNLSFDEAKTLAKAIIQSVEDLQLAYTYLSQKHYLSISVGGFYSTHTQKTIHSLIEEADQALYASKDEGRNTYTLFRDTEDTL